MNNHRKIIGNIYFGLGILLSVLVILSWQNNAENIDQAISNSIYWSMVASVIPFLIAGFLLLADYSYAHWVCLPVSILFLFAFPIGTVIGGYYLWFFWQNSRNGK